MKQAPEEGKEPLAAARGPEYGALASAADRRFSADLEANKSHLAFATQEHPDVKTIEEIPKQCQGPYETAMEVGIACKVISISNVDLAAGTFMADININVAWKGKTKDDGPAIQLYNVVELSEQERSPEEGAKKGSKGWDWFYRVRCRGTFRQEYFLHHFPFDQQRLSVNVRLKKQVRLTKLAWGFSGEACSCDPRAMTDEFALEAAYVRHRYMPSYKFGDLDGYDPEAALIFTVKRRPLFWVVSYGLVASFVCSMMGCCYAIPASDIADRLGVALTLFLTMTATKFLMAEKLPSVSYFTLLDIHVVICGLLLMSLTVQLSCTPLLGVYHMERVEQWMLPTIAVIWLVYHVVVLVLAGTGTLDG